MFNQVRSTSREAYQAVKDDGTLSKRLKEAYSIFHSDGPLTGQELNSKMLGDGAWKLCSPLKKADLIEEVDKVKCKVTGRSAYAWDVTGRKPKIIRKSITKEFKIDSSKSEIKKLIIYLADGGSRVTRKAIVDRLNIIMGILED